MTEPEPLYVIAEMACSHEGDPALARTIIDAAGHAGADAVQFQIWLAKDLMGPPHPAVGQVWRPEPAPRRLRGRGGHPRRPGPEPPTTTGRLGPPQRGC